MAISISGRTPDSLPTAQALEAAGDLGLTHEPALACG
jgi:hypothetical protein